MSKSIVLKLLGYSPTNFPVGQISLSNGQKDIGYLYLTKWGSSDVHSNVEINIDEEFLKRLLRDNQ